MEVGASAFWFGRRPVGSLFLRKTTDSVNLMVSEFLGVLWDMAG